jgi:hypothetical protein
MFSEHLGELRGIFEKEISAELHARRIAKLRGAADLLFGRVDDTVREAALMATGRKLSAQALAETPRAGLKSVFGSK